MTEQEWLSCDDPEPMIQFSRDKVNNRKLRLFACACCRNIWHLLDDQNRTFIESAEKCADGTLTEDERRRINRVSDGVSRSRMQAAVGGRDLLLFRHFHVAMMAGRTLDEFPLVAAIETFKEWKLIVEDGAGMGDQGPNPRVVSGQVQADHLRDIVGNPFRPVSVDSSWLNSNVTALAQAIYDEHAYDRLPILADALEEAGCTNADILGHCRQPVEHVRGCWALDLIVGRE